jgi:hypothetical protein
MIKCYLFPDESNNKPLPTNVALPLDCDGDILSIGDHAQLLCPSGPSEIVDMRTVIIDFDQLAECIDPVLAVEVLFDYGNIKEWHLARDVVKVDNGPRAA